MTLKLVTPVAPATSASGVAMAAPASPAQGLVEDPTMSLEEAGRLLGWKSYDSFRRAELRGEITLTRLTSRTIRIRRSEVDRLIEARSKPFAKQQRHPHFERSAS
jgi:hypothetical protein